MDTKTFFLAETGLIFALVALLHLVRIFEDWPIIIGDWSVPKSVSWVALIVAGGPRPSRVEAQRAKRVGQGWRRNEDQAPADPCVSKDFALAHRKKLPARKSELARALVGKTGKQR